MFGKKYSTLIVVFFGINKAKGTAGMEQFLMVWQITFWLFLLAGTGLLFGAFWIKTGCGRQAESSTTVQRLTRAGHLVLLSGFMLLWGHALVGAFTKPDFILRLF